MKTDQVKVVRKLSKVKASYSVQIDDNEYLLHEETILKFRLVEGKEVTNILEILDYNSKIELYDKVLNYTRSYPNSKYMYYLIYKNRHNIDISFILDLLEERNLIDDNLYAKEFIASLVRKGYGKRVIYERLKEKHLDTNLLDEFSDTDSLDSLVEKMLRQFSKYQGKELRNKIYNYLIRRGYSYSQVKDVLAKLSEG